MPACSSACSAPGTCSGDSRAPAITSGPTVYQNARVDETGRRQVERLEPERGVRAHVPYGRSRPPGW